MTPRQQAFAAEYALDHCDAAAAVRAGYAKPAAHVTASRLLRKAKVADLVADHEAESARHLRVSRETVLEEVQEAIALAREKGDTAGMISGLKLICQMCGFLAPERTKVEISVDGKAMQARIAAMSDGELLAIAEGRGE